MKLQDQVCSLELAKRLKELGVKQDSLYAWTIVGRLKQDETKSSIVAMLKIPTFNPKHIPYYSAFTVAEIGDILPDCFTTYRNNEVWKCAWDSLYNEKIKDFKSRCETEADARAKILIYLIENGLIKNG